VSIRQLATFEEIEPTFRERVDAMVWAAVATVDTLGRPATRLLHPIWEGQTGWIGTHRNSIKHRHLEKNSSISMAYVADVVHPVYVEAVAAWEESMEEKHRIWELFRTTPEPLGYDPAISFGSYDHENFGLLRVTPRKITLATLAGDPWQIVWKASDPA
jgi:uncharacterized pyridoxamine 5'-phosphate oxidase family protein